MSPSFRLVPPFLVPPFLVPPFLVPETFEKFRVCLKKRGSFVGIVNIGDGCPVADFLEIISDPDGIGDCKKKTKKNRLFHTFYPQSKYC